MKNIKILFTLLAIISWAREIVCIFTNNPIPTYIPIITAIYISALFIVSAIESLYVPATLECVVEEHNAGNTDDLIKSLQAKLMQKTEEAEGMRTNWYKCVENLAASQRREQAAVKDLSLFPSCVTCKHKHGQFDKSGKCGDCDIEYSGYEWRGHKEEDAV